MPSSCLPLPWVWTNFGLFFELWNYAETGLSLRLVVIYLLGLSRLYRPYTGWKDVDLLTNESITQSEAFTTFPNAFETLFWSLFTMGSAADTKIASRTVESITNASVKATVHLTLVEHFGNIIYAGNYLESAPGQLQLGADAGTTFSLFTFQVIMSWRLWFLWICFCAWCPTPIRLWMKTRTWNGNLLGSR